MQVPARRFQPSASCAREARACLGSVAPQNAIDMFRLTCQQNARRRPELTSAFPMSSAGGWVTGIEVVARVVRYLRVVVVVVVVGIKVVKERADIRYATNFRVSIDSNVRIRWLCAYPQSTNKQSACKFVRDKELSE